MVSRRNNQANGFGTLQILCREGRVSEKTSPGEKVQYVPTPERCCSQVVLSSQFPLKSMEAEVAQHLAGLVPMGDTTHVLWPLVASP